MRHETCNTIKTNGDFVAVLHNIRSLHNVGSIFRTADGAGIKKIYLCGITPAPVDALGRTRQQFTKVSLGAEKYVEWVKLFSTIKTIKKLKTEGYEIIAIEQSKEATPLYKFKTKNSRYSHGIRKIRIALVVGNEVKGLPPSVLKLADKILEIPMLGSKESLNVSVAFGIVAYHISSIMNK